MNLKNQELETFCSQIRQYNHIMLKSGLMIRSGQKGNSSANRKGHGGAKWGSQIHSPKVVQQIKLVYTPRGIYQKNPFRPFSEPKGT